MENFYKNGNNMKKYNNWFWYLLLLTCDDADYHIWFDPTSNPDLMVRIKIHLLSENWRTYIYEVDISKVPMKSLDTCSWLRIMGYSLLVLMKLYLVIIMMMRMRITHFFNTIRITTIPQVWILGDNVSSMIDL